MSEAKPKSLRGPWKAVSPVNTFPQVWTEDQSACVSDRVFNHCEHLIAAAPDLLDALKDMISEGCSKNGEWISTATFKKAKAAISRAEGKSC